MDLVIGIAALLALGMAAQWIAWRVGLPSILLLLAFGFAAGPGRLGWIDPDALLGDRLFPLVSLAVAIILFEGGLSLCFRDILEHRRVVILLVTLGAAVTWLLCGLAAYFVLGLPAGLSSLLGAVLIVSGPTVVLPLLRHIKPTGPSGPILKWEGIVIDPIGAVAALLVYEEIIVVRGTPLFALGGIVNTLVAGFLFGLAGAGLLVAVLRRYWVPDHLHVALALTVVVGAFVGANAIQHESGLLAVTVLGVALANQRKVPIHHILEFKEHLRVLLISTLFLLLAARLQVSQLDAIDGSAFAFLAILLLIVRPISVWLCTLGSSLSRADRIFMAWMCPRGIVAAAVASVFSLQLAADEPAAERLVPLTFLVIVGTVVVYGLTAPILARRLGLSNPHPQGVLFVGAADWVRKVSASLKDLGIRVIVADTNRRNVRAARMQGIETWYGNVLAEHGEEGLDLSGVGRVIAVTPNDDVNSLAALHFQHEFGRQSVFRLALGNTPTANKHAENRDDGSPQPSGGRHGRVVFGEGTDYGSLAQRFHAGGRVKVTQLGDEFDFEAFQARYGGDALVLFVLSPEGKLEVHARDRHVEPRAGWTIVALVPPELTYPA